MDAPPETCGSQEPFLKVAAHLEGLGYSVPILLAEHKADGLLLLEDFGDGLFARILETKPELEVEAYCSAVDLLIDIARHPLKRGFPSYHHKLQSELSALSLKWYLPAATGSDATGDQIRELRSHVEAGLALVDTENVFMHRDYHAENLIWLPKREGLRRVGIIDFQDGSIGHQAYDLVSLLEDARRDLAEGLPSYLINRYADSTGLAVEQVESELAVVGVQRNLRIIGVFARLAVHDGKRHYLGLLPRVWGHLLHDLSHPVNLQLARFVRKTLPAPTSALLGRLGRARPAVTGRTP